MTIELLNKILAYLGTKPYIETVELINEILEANRPKETEAVEEIKEEIKK